MADFSGCENCIFIGTEGVLSNQPNKALKINNGSHRRFYCSGASYLHAIRMLLSNHKLIRFKKFIINYFFIYI
jgi:hypothetical protein